MNAPREGQMKKVMLLLGAAAIAPVAAEARVRLERALSALQQPA